MQMDTQRFLDLVEKSKTLASFDIEATGLRGDYNSILCLSVKPYGEKPTTFSVVQPGNDQKVVREAKELLESMDCWITYYGKGFDVKMLDTRLLKWGLHPVQKRPHIDMYYQLKSHILTARRSQAHLLEWLDTPEKKMTVGADMWNDVIRNPAKTMKIMVDRCESDCAGLETLYARTRHVIQDIRR